MPELPEVQTIIDDLRKKIIGRKIINVWFDVPKLIKKPKPQDLKNKIQDLRITDIQRRGKNILFYLNPKLKILNPKILLIHQKLTGHLLYGKWSIKKISNFKFQVSSLIKGSLEEKVNNYIHLIIYLDNGWQVGLSDMRKFAKILFGEKEEIESLPDLVELGPNPTDKSFSVNKFISLISSRKQKIKQVLMDQSVVAGIGNIYSDEILWQAKIHPFKPANKLTAGEFKNLYKAIKSILQKAVKLRGSSIIDFRDAFGKSGGYAKIRKVYRREGEKCQRCQNLIKRVKMGGRSAHYCPKCQR